MESRFHQGQVVVRREMLDGREWLVYPVRVAGDDERELAVYLARGTPLTFGGGDFRWGPHPWIGFAHTWQSGGVLQLQRPGENYAVWGRWENGTLREWYVNFQAPFSRTDRGFDTLDHELDLVIPGDGAPYRWKDVDHFEERVRAGGFTPGEERGVREAAERVVGLLERGECWWERWRDWRAPVGWDVPGPVPLQADAAR
ncbi:DUF402 domain-containing protein [Streptomyces sp. LP05-1]|uniref:DUF402 domain-containing protein n=1 Tax=Streptomyces pyxinae TaxID=2970734 RepID=A0ABT2CGN3_9ACTN|nr:DUF402 domain-containing protein [Streptomyces sp. LP05-1]MCS0635764.1 DUF402 domain-containing protein [Streptomyces sp. LP05-1]